MSLTETHERIITEAREALAYSCFLFQNAQTTAAEVLWVHRKMILTEAGVLFLCRKFKRKMSNEVVTAQNRRRKEIENERSSFLETCATDLERVRDRESNSTQQTENLQQPVQQEEETTQPACETGGTRGYATSLFADLPESVIQQNVRAVQSAPAYCVSEVPAKDPEYARNSKRKDAQNVWVEKVNKVQTQMPSVIQTRVIRVILSPPVEVHKCVICLSPDLVNGKDFLKLLHFWPFMVVHIHVIGQRYFSINDDGKTTPEQHTITLERVLPLPEDLEEAAMRSFIRLVNSQEVHLLPRDLTC